MLSMTRCVTSGNSLVQRCFAAARGSRFAQISSRTTLARQYPAAPTMWRKTRVTVARLAVGILFFTFAVDVIDASTLITFDDLTPRSSSEIPYPYHGLVFSGDPYDGILRSINSTIPGVGNGAVSSPNVLLSAGQSNSIQAYRPEDRAVFILYSGYFTSAYDSVLTVQALGFTPDDTSSPAFVKTFSINNTGPTLITFDWIGITDVELTGGYAPFSPNQYVLDDLLVDTGVPEPKATALMCVGLSMLYVGIRIRNQVVLIRQR